MSASKVAQEVAASKPSTPTDCNAVKAYDWDVRVAYAVCMAESRGNPNANNAGTNSDGSVDRGLMQVNSIHADMVGGDLDKLYDPKTNLDVAYSLSHNGTDWTAWSAYNSGRYTAFL